RASADDDDTVADVRPGIPRGIDRRLEIGGEDGPSRRDGVREYVHRTRRHVKAGLMGVEREDAASAQERGAFFDNADVRVAVFDRRWKLSGLERRAHPLVFTLRYASFEHRELGAPAHAGVQRPDGDITIPSGRQPLFTNLAAPRGGDPKRTVE